MPVAISRTVALLVAIAACGFHLALGQSALASRVLAEEHIQHVTSGLIGGIVLKGQEHATHTLAERMRHSMFQV